MKADLIKMRATEKIHGITEETITIEIITTMIDAVNAEEVTEAVDVIKIHTAVVPVPDQATIPLLPTIIRPTITTLTGLRPWQLHMHPQPRLQTRKPWRFSRRIGNITLEIQWKWRT